MFKLLLIGPAIIIGAMIVANILESKTVVVWCKKRHNNKVAQIKGEMAENEVATILSHFENENCRVIHGCLFEFADGNTTQIDHIIINQKGVYVIETKNYSGEIFKINDKQWCHRNGRYENYFYSPVMQNENHIKAIMKKIGLNDKKYFHSIIAFSEKAQLPLVNHESVPVIHIRDLGKELQKDSDVLITANSVNTIYNAIIKANKNSKTYMRKHINNVKRKYGN